MVHNLALQNSAAHRLLSLWANEQLGNSWGNKEAGFANGTAFQMHVHEFPTDDKRHIQVLTPPHEVRGQEQATLSGYLSLCFSCEAA